MVSPKTIAPIIANGAIIVNTTKDRPNNSTPSPRLITASIPSADSLSTVPAANINNLIVRPNKVAPNIAKGDMIE